VFRFLPVSAQSCHDLCFFVCFKAIGDPVR